jgi:hypothetical protein
LVRILGMRTTKNRPREIKQFPWDNGRLIPMWKYMVRRARQQVEVPETIPFERYQKSALPKHMTAVMIRLYLHEQLKLAGSLRITHDHDKKEIRVARWIRTNS